MLHIGGIVCYVHFFFLVLYVLFTSLHTLVKNIEKASSCAVFSQIKPRYVTSNVKNAVCAPYSLERNSHGAVLEFVIEFRFRFTCKFTLARGKVGKEKSQLDQIRMVRASACHLVSASTPFSLPGGPGPTPRFPPAIAEDGASFREPINDAPGQPKDSLRNSVILETISDTSALVLAPCGLKSETKIGIFFF